MSLIWLDGFEQFGQDESSYHKAYTVQDIHSIVSGYDGGCAVVLFSTSDSITAPVNDLSTIVVGVRVSFNTYISSIQPIIEFTSSSDSHGDLWLNASDLSLFIRDSNPTTKDVTSAGIVSLYTWYYLEIKFVLNTSMEVKLNGSVILYDNTGDYQYGSDYIRGVRIASVASMQTYYDDLYITDSEYLGEIVVRSYEPTADGTYSQLTPSAGSDHYALVDEIYSGNPSDSDYNEGDAVGEKDTFTATSSLTGNIKGVAVMTRALKVGDTTTKIKNMIRTGGSDYLGSGEKNLTGNSLYHQEVWQTNPDTSNPWTASEVNSLEFGTQITVISTTTTV